MALLKCQHCSEKSERESMEVIEKTSETGKTTRQYVHKTCFEDYLKDKAFKAKEAKELDDLYNVIKDYHKMDIIPHTFFGSYLQPVRNGNFKLGKKIVKRKEGYPYPIIQKAYELAKQNILWARKNVKLEKAMDELRYCFAIVIDNLPLAQKKATSEKRQESIVQAKEEAKQTIVLEIEAEREMPEYKSKKNKKDISRFLD